MPLDADAPIPTEETRRDDLLESWKEIANYLGRGVTTVQRWEQDEGLPVHRLAHAKKGSVFAYKREIDTWRRSRTQLAPERTTPAAPLPQTAPVANLERGVQAPAVARRRRTVVLSVAFSLSILTVGAISMTWMGRRSESGTTDTAARVEPRPIASEQSSEGDPSLSPDGSKVVYSWALQGDTQLYVKPIPGGGPPAAVPSPRSASYSAWSPRGDLIAFLTWETENMRALHIVAPEGGKPRRLALISGTWLCWTPDGRAIGFSDRNSTTEPFAIVTLDLATGERRRLTTPPPGSFGDTGCAFSPDGRTVAVSRYSNRYQSDVFLSVFPETPDNPATRLTTGFPGIEGLAWSPDGRTIVMGSSVGLWRVDAQSLPGKPLLVAGAAMTLRAPSFGMPAGGPPRLAYEHVNRDVNVWRWTIGSTEPAAIPGWPGWDDHPALAPDGQRIAFASNRTGHNEIWIDSLQGGMAQRLTHHDGPLVISPRWSPDGTQIAFSSQVAANRDIYVIGADGAASRRLTFEPSQEELPNWSRDGRWIFFRSDRAGVGQIWKAPADGGPAIRVTQGEASTVRESEDGRTLYFTRGPHTPGVWSVPSDGGREVLLAPGIREGHWDVVKDGLYYIDWVWDDKTLKRFDLTSRKTTTLRAWTTAKQIITGFSVSRDARTIVWTQQDVAQSDIMLIDPWR